MRSLKRERVYQVGNYLITQRRTGFSLSGCTNESLGRRFTIDLIRRGKWRLTGKSSTGSRCEYESGWIDLNWGGRIGSTL